MSIVSGMAFGSVPASRKRCSFCGRRDEVVEHLVRARGGTYICDRCVAQAHEAIANAPPDERMLRIRPTPARVADRDTAELAVERAFETLFNPELPIPERCAAIVGGANLTTAMQQVNDRYPARDVEVAVDYVRFLSEDEAEVRFVLFLLAVRTIRNGTDRTRRAGRPGVEGVPGHVVPAGRDGRRRVPASRGMTDALRRRAAPAWHLCDAPDSRRT